MTTSPALEDRVRRGLHAAAAALPSGPAEPDALPAPRADGPVPGRRWARPVIAAAVATLAVLGGTTLVRGATDVAMPGAGGAVGDPGAGPATPSTATPTAVKTPPVLLAPGQVVGHGDNVEIFDTQGNPTRTVPLGLTLAGAVEPDLRGGFVACGTTGDTKENRHEQIVWLKADGQRVVLAPDVFGCPADGIGVYDSAAGPVAVFATNLVRDDLRLTVLETGETRPLAVPPLAPDQSAGWSVADGKLLRLTAGGPQLFDLTTGAELSRPGWTATDGGSDLVLAPDARSVATITGSASGPVEVTVSDLATGAVRFRESVPMPAEGAELAYDGTTLAFGNWYDGPGYPPVTVIDLASGARHTVATHGSLP
jgi:hypothetical protein